MKPESTDERFAKNMCFASTVITSGRGKAVVTTIGMKTQVGKIASSLAGEKAKLYAAAAVPEPPRRPDRRHLHLRAHR